MDSIVTYLLIQNQYLLNVIYQLLLFIAKFIPLKQWAFEDSNSPKYNKFKFQGRGLTPPSLEGIRF